MADGGPVGAEQGADDRGGQVQVLAHPGGEQVVGEVELAVGPAGALRPLAGASVPEVAVLLAAGAERDLQRGGQGGQARRVHAGQRGMVQRAHRRRGRDGLAVVPAPVPGRAGERAGRCSSTRHGSRGVFVAVFDVFDLLVADPGPGGAGVAVQDGGDGQWQHHITKQWLGCAAEMAGRQKCRAIWCKTMAAADSI